MDIISKINKWTPFIGLGAFVVTIFVSAVLLGIGAGEAELYRENKFFPIGFNPFYDVALSCTFIAILFLVPSVLVKLFVNVPVRIISLFLLVFAARQCVLLMKLPPLALPSSVSDYSNSPEIVVILGYSFLAISIMLIVLHISMIWPKTSKPLT